VSKSFLAETELGEDKIRDSVNLFMPYSFNLVNQLCGELLIAEKKHIYITPKSFLELIKLFISMLNKKKTSLENNKERYETGLVKLNKT